jgi:hypothetical protein
MSSKLGRRFFTLHINQRASILIQFSFDIVSAHDIWFQVFEWNTKCEIQLDNLNPWLTETLTQTLAADHDSRRAQLDFIATVLRLLKHTNANRLTPIVTCLQLKFLFILISPKAVWYHTTTWFRCLPKYHCHFENMLSIFGFSWHIPWLVCYANPSRCMRTNPQRFCSGWKTICVHILPATVSLKCFFSMGFILPVSLDVACRYLCPWTFGGASTAGRGRILAATEGTPWPWQQQKGQTHGKYSWIKLSPVYVCVFGCMYVWVLCMQRRSLQLWYLWRKGMHEDCSSVHCAACIHYARTYFLEKKNKHRHVHIHSHKHSAYLRMAHDLKMIIADSKKQFLSKQTYMQNTT